MAHGPARPKRNGAIINAEVDDVDLDAYRERDVSNTTAGDSSALNGPALFHKVKNQKSILAIAVSDSRIFAGTQGGELLVGLVCPESNRYSS